MTRQYGYTSLDQLPDLKEGYERHYLHNHGGLTFGYIDTPIGKDALERRVELTYVVSNGPEDLAWLKTYGDLPDDFTLIQAPQQVEGLRFFKGDRLVVGIVDTKDERLAIIQRSLVVTGHWLTVTPITDVTFGEPKRNW
jgi:hypothetical protein